MPKDRKRYAPLINILAGIASGLETMFWLGAGDLEAAKDSGIAIIFNLASGITPYTNKGDAINWANILYNTIFGVVSRGVTFQKPSKSILWNIYPTLALVTVTASAAETYKRKDSL
jgi:hypothetical protein